MGRVRVAVSTPNPTTTTHTVPVPGGRRHALDDESDGYRVFSRAYDETRSLASAGAPGAAARIPRALDRAIEASGVSARALGPRARRSCLAEPHDDGWEGGRESGFDRRPPAGPARRLRRASATSSGPKRRAPHRLHRVLSRRLLGLDEGVQRIGGRAGRRVRARAGTRRRRLRGARLHHRRLERRARPARLEPRRAAAAIPDASTKFATS